MRFFLLYLPSSPQFCRVCILFSAAEVKATETVGPVLIHCVTEKGRGYLPAESASDKMHGVVKYDPITGKQQKSKGGVSALKQKTDLGRIFLHRIAM